MEAQGHLHLVAFFEEALGRAHLHIVIVVVDIRAEFDLLDLDHLLLLARFVLALLFLVFVFADIEDFAHRRIGIGRNLNEIQSRFVGFEKGGFTIHHSKVGAVCTFRDRHEPCGYRSGG